MTYKAWLFAIALLVLGAQAAFGQATQIFSATLTGTFSCNDFNVVKTKLPLFVAFDTNEFVLALDSNFTEIFLDVTIFALYDASSTSIVFGAFEEAPNLIAVVNGSAKVSGNLATSFSGTVNLLSSNGVQNCILNGSVKSGKLLAVQP
jgi:hypothetical protein